MVEAIHAASSGGVDFAFEVTGVSCGAVAMHRRAPSRGKVVIVSIRESNASFQPNTLVIKERTMRGIIAYRHVCPAVMALMQRGYFRAEDLVTDRIALDDVLGKRFEQLLNDKSRIKIMVTPPG